jgi:preprotein translocase subunit SecG
LVITAFAALIMLGTLIWVALSSSATTQAFFADLAADAQGNSVGSVSGHMIRLALQVTIGVVALLGITLILRGKERRGTLLAVISVVLSLTAVQLITFYLNQFTAIVPTLFQFALLLVILAYQQWYLVPESKHKP